MQHNASAPAKITEYRACQSEILKSDILKTRVVMEIMCPAQVDCAAISGEQIKAAQEDELEYSKLA